jgi:hypothetical protein
MTCILTADIINSRKDSSGQWLLELKDFFAAFGPTPATWEIYRGDAFQLELSQPEEAFRLALQIKALLKMRKLDARISIGIGEKTVDAKKITESNGSAFVRSGELFETLKPQKLVLALNSGDEKIDRDVNLVLRLASSLISNWLPQSAEFVRVALENPQFSQEELGKKLGIAQAAVSRRQKRAQFDLIMDTEAWFRQTIKTLSV